METLLIALGAGFLYLVAYHTYGKWLASKLFKLDPEATVPSVALNDDKDYVPTDKGIIFGHHFTSIAGTGPIVGPAVAVIWGWVPALLWVLFGSILIGAVHDFGSLVVSMRNRGQTVGDIAGRVLTKRTRMLFLLILFMALTIVLAIFGLVIASVFKQNPASIFPCLVQIPLAILIGVYLHRRGINILVPSLVSLALMYLTVYYGNFGILGVFNNTLAGWPIMIWVGVLLVYSYIASVLPVWVLLQPRDYINSLQLLSALALVVAGLVIAGLIGGAPIASAGSRTPLEIVAPAVRMAPEGAPLIFPFLFITIACGAISGFHCLVSSGTSSKQIKCETDAQLVGYGSMLTEGFLAVLVILACVAGLGLGIAGSDGSLALGASAYEARYETWGGANSLAAKIGAFVEGSGNFLRALGLNAEFAVALMGVFVASFAATTLDTACRLQRYVIQELASTFAPKILPSALASEACDIEYNRRGTDRSMGAPADMKPHVLNPFTWLTNKHGASIFAVVLATGIASIPGGSGMAAGTGGLILWPLFGATNQLLAGLAFLVITFWLWRRNLPLWFIAIPMVFMLILPGIAMSLNVFVGENSFLKTGNWLLVLIGCATLALQI
ncbi:MAG: carbon starvation protein A, partial [Opitutales bacterium]|nr:carbon starvation protein A [Opitutales bacterium]